MERPILFNGAMVRAILSGAKTQTRRPLKQKVVSNGYRWDRETGEILCHFDYVAPSEYLVETKYGLVPLCEDPSLCPYGRDDRLWVRECFGIFDRSRFGGREGYAVAYRADEPDGVDRGVRWIDGPEDWSEELVKADSKWRPSIHMPRWASRLTLQVTGIRLERLQDINEEDARAEGVVDGGCLSCGDLEPCGCANPTPSARDSFIGLWRDTYGPDSWTANPWVWVVSFEVVK